MVSHCHIFSVAEGNAPWSATKGPALAWSRSCRWALPNIRSGHDRKPSQPKSALAALCRILGAIRFGGALAVGDLRNEPSLGLDAMLCSVCCALIFCFLSETAFLG